MQRRLGRGLDFLISGEVEGSTKEEILQLAPSEIRANPHQPRRAFAEIELSELAASIAEHGILQPVVVRATDEGYELIAGERRLRACERLGRETVPAIVRAASDEQMLELALIENIQREDLNAIDTALAIRSLIDRLDLTQEEAAQRLGKSRPAIANTLRLLELPTDLQARVAEGTLSSGHARALLTLADADAQRALAERVEKAGLSVRATESAARKQTRPSEPAERGGIDPGLAPYLHDLEDQLRATLGTRVTIQPRGEKGRVVIEYFSREELEGLLDRLLGEASDV